MDEHEPAIDARLADLRRRRAEAVDVLSETLLDMYLKKRQADRAGRVWPGLARDDVLAQLSEALAVGRFNREVLVDQAMRWATPEVLRMVSASLAGAELPHTGLIQDVRRQQSRVKQRIPA